MGNSLDGDWDGMGKKRLYGQIHIYCRAEIAPNDRKPKGNCGFGESTSCFQGANFPKLALTYTQIYPKTCFL